MTTDEVMALCAGHPGAALSYPFGEGTGVYKVGGKIFAIVDADRQPGSISLKAEPLDVAGLIETHEAIGPGYHLNKKHWVTVGLGKPLPDSLLAELIEDSYDLIVDKLPKRDRP